MGVFKQAQQQTQSGGGVFAQARAQQTSQAPQSDSIWQSIANSAGNFAQGVAKGELATVKGLGTIGQKVLDQTAGRVVNAATGKGFTPTGPDGTVSDLYRNMAERSQQADALLKPQGTAENIGYGAEKILEAFAPAGMAAKGEQAINVLAQGLKSKLAQAAVRVVGKGAVQGAASAGVNYVQTGGDIKSSIEAGAIGGTIRGGLATIGEGVNALRLPERIYSTIFKNSSGDMLQQLKSGAIQALQRDNPERYKELLDAGIIHVGKNGAPIVNESLAKEALDRGLRGSTKTMANTVVTGALDSEHAAQTIASGYKGTVAFPEKQFVNVLKDVEAQYADVGFGDISEEAGRLVKALETNGGNVSAVDALSIRRLLDKLRISSSYNQPAPKLSLTQANFKALADAARKRVNDLPGMSQVMKDYSFHIEALEALSKEAARSGNTQILSLIDSVFLGSGLSAANPSPAIAAGLIRKYLLTPGGKTLFANMLNKATTPNGVTLNGLITGASTGAQSMLEGQQQ